MKDNLDNIDFETAEKREREIKHDVMAHIHTFCLACPKAAPIIHLGATSCFVGDNTDCIVMRDGMKLVQKSLLHLIKLLRDMSIQYKDLPTLAFTHYQPAQLTTVGKRASLWLQDFLFDYQNVERIVNERIVFLGIKGTTGTQASFLELFEGDHSKVKNLDTKVANLMGFERSVGVSGQTYTRKIDFEVLSVLSGIAQSAHKMAGDIRHLMNLKEIEEPFAKDQVGSSAMPYKRNPMKSERICGLARFVISLAENPAHTFANQWFERTLDDSANRRLSLPQAFLATDVVLSLSSQVIDHIQVWPRVIRKHIDAELPFMATENIMMAAVKKGGDRQELHEAIRVHSMEAGRLIKQEGSDNDLLDRIKADPLFASVADLIHEITDPSSFVGRSPQQVEEFVAEEVDPVLARNSALLTAFEPTEQYRG
eukprot:TRINITY_DN6940_c0_g1_i1.p2 TRINITY_DN6940_c0_g1~~TRINITY_DN6940_c0_g1_i1.p2  ORF type:complete len:487 (-),score=193.32 TRINITY_DN6940_c0_g1_i1:13-1287(-)